MQIIKVNIVVLLVLAMPVLAFSSSRPASSGLFTIESSGTQNVRVVETSAVQRDDELIIAGKVKLVNRHAKGWIAQGHIDVTLIDSNGETLHETTADYSPRVIPRKTNACKSSFRLKVPAVAPVGSVLHLSFHSKSHS